MPWIGLATGLVLFFAGAVTAHIRVGYYSTIARPVGYLVLAAGALGLRLAAP